MADAELKTLTPFDRLCVAAGQMVMRLSQEAETIPPALWEEIHRAEQGTDGETPAQDLLLVSAFVVAMPRYRGSTAAREAFCAAAKLYGEMEGTGK